MAAGKRWVWGALAAGSLLGVGCASDKEMERETTETASASQAQVKTQAEQGKPPCPEGMVRRSELSEAQRHKLACDEQRRAQQESQDEAGIGGTGEEEPLPDEALPEEAPPMEGTGGAEGGGG